MGTSKNNCMSGIKKSRTIHLKQIKQTQPALGHTHVKFNSEYIRKYLEHYTDTDTESDIVLQPSTFIVFSRVIIYSIDIILAF